MKLTNSKHSMKASTFTSPLVGEVGQRPGEGAQHCFVHTPHPSASLRTSPTRGEVKQAMKWPMKLILSAILCLLTFSQVSAEEVLHETTKWIESDKVILRGLDKISARVFTSEVFVNQKVHFGSLEIYVRSASRSPPEDQPESACFLEIYDNKQGQQRQKVFSGWMFSSNPALSALEHSVYDIWVKEVVTQPDPDSEVTPEAAPEIKAVATTKAAPEDDDNSPED